VHRVHGGKDCIEGSRFDCLPERLTPFYDGFRKVGLPREYAFDTSMRFSLTSVDETDARRAVARVGPTSGQRRRPRRNFTILRHAIDSANSAEKALIRA